MHRVRVHVREKKAKEHMHGERVQARVRKIRDLPISLYTHTHVEIYLCRKSTKSYLYE